MRCHFVVGRYTWKILHVPGLSFAVKRRFVLPEGLFVRFNRVPLAAGTARLVRMSAASARKGYPICSKQMLFRSEKQNMSFQTMRSDGSRFRAAE